jgi:transcription-repair coupling factor (superfamily II helicase)
VDSQKLHVVYGLSDGLKYKVIVTYSDLKAKELYEEYKFYDRNVMLYPAKDLIFFQADIHGNQLTRERVKTLRRLMENKPVTIVTTIDGGIDYVLPLPYIKENAATRQPEYPLTHTKDLFAASSTGL